MPNYSKGGAAAEDVFWNADVLLKFLGIGAKTALEWFSGRLSLGTLADQGLLAWLRLRGSPPRSIPAVTLHWQLPSPASRSLVPLVGLWVGS